MTDANNRKWMAIYWLQNDEEAGKTFFGENAELKENELYQNV